MKFSTTFTPLFFASLALSSPAPAAHPNPNSNAVAALPHEFVARTMPILDTRAKKPKGGSDNSNNTNTTGAADMMSPSRAQQLGALGVGVLEIVRLW
jgi:hypothetical protein